MLVIISITRALNQLQILIHYYETIENYKTKESIDTVMWKNHQMDDGQIGWECSMKGEENSVCGCVWKRRTPRLWVT